MEAQKQYFEDCQKIKEKILKSEKILGNIRKYRECKHAEGNNNTYYYLGGLDKKLWVGLRILTEKRRVQYGKEDQLRIYENYCRNAADKIYNEKQKAPRFSIGVKIGGLYGLLTEDFTREGSIFMMDAPEFRVNCDAIISKRGKVWFDLDEVELFEMWGRFKRGALVFMADDNIIKI